MIKKNLKIESAPTNKIDKYYEEIRIIVRSLGHKACYITDESIISDFLPCFGKNWKQDMEEVLKKSKKRIRMELKPNDKLISAAKRLRKNNEERQIKNDNK